MNIITAKKRLFQRKKKENFVCSDIKYLFIVVTIFRNVNERKKKAKEIHYKRKRKKNDLFFLKLSSIINFARLFVFPDTIIS